MAHERLVAQLQWRYSVKKFDSTRKISEENWRALEKALVLTPSSFGLQPWRFVVVLDPEVRKELRRHSWNQSQVEDCSHYVVLCALDKVDQPWVDRYVQTMADLRGVTVDSLQKLRAGISREVITGSFSKFAKEWAIRQVYLALGNLVTSAAMLDIDSCPMEGFDPEKYNEVLQLKGTEFSTVVACALGYRAADDWLAPLKKVRFPVEDVVKYV